MKKASKIVIKLLANVARYTQHESCVVQIHDGSRWPAIGPAGPGEVQWTIASICPIRWNLFLTLQKSHFGEIHG